MINIELKPLRVHNRALTTQDLSCHFVKLKAGENIEIPEGNTFHNEDIKDFFQALSNIDDILESAVGKIQTNNLEFLKQSTGYLRKNTTEEPRIFVIDSHNLFHRVYHSHRSAENDNGDTITILKATMALIQWIITTKDRYSHIIFASEGETLLRRDIFPEYKLKSSRKPDLDKQIAFTEKVLQDLGFTVLKKDGYEADDVIATLAKNYNVTVFTSDQDIYQLYKHKGFEVMDPKTKDILPSISAQTKFSVPAELLGEYQGIVGESAKGIPGIPGFGKTAAVKIVNEYGTLENLYENIDRYGLEDFATGDKIPKAKQASADKKQAALVEAKEIAFKSREVMTLVDNIYSAWELEDFHKTVAQSVMPFASIKPILSSRLKPLGLKF